MTRKISRSVALWVTGVFIALAGALSAATVTEGEARAAASAFVAADPVGSAVLRGRTVSTVYERDGLWIAALSPSGHVILSGSDLADPIVGFSTNDFAEPDPDSPAYAYLAGISASLTAQESKGGVRHARWNRLLGGGTSAKLMAADIESPATIVIPPFQYKQPRLLSRTQPMRMRGHCRRAGISVFPLARAHGPCRVLQPLLHGR